MGLARRLFSFRPVYSGPVDRVGFVNGFLCCAAIDDVTYGAPIPEPAGFTLAAVGFGLMLYRRAGNTRLRRG